MPADALSDDGLRTALHSWRSVLFSRMHFNDSVYALFDKSGNHLRVDLSKPWNAPENAPFRRGPYPAMSTLAALVDEAQGRNTPRFAAVVDKGTAFDPEGTTPLGEMPPSLIVLIEASDCPYHWMEPGDLSLSEVPKLIQATEGWRLGVDGDDAFAVIFADGSVWFLLKNFS